MALLSHFAKMFFCGVAGLLLSTGAHAQKRGLMTPEATDAAFGSEAVCRPLPEDCLMTGPDDEFLYTSYAFSD